MKTKTTTGWTGRHGDHWVHHRDRYDRMLEAFGVAVIDGAEVQVGDRVLDVGSGAGATTIMAARSTGSEGHVTAIDLSPALLATATDRAEDQGLHQIDFVRGDAQAHPFEPAAYDSAISRFGLMLFEDPQAGFDNVARALRPGGRLAFATWQHRTKNLWSTLPERVLLETLTHTPALDMAAMRPPPPTVCPFSLADPERIRGLLSRAGFEHLDVRASSQPIWIASDVDDAVEFFEDNAGADVRAALGEQALDAVRQALRDRLRTYGRDDGVFLPERGMDRHGTTCRGPTLDTLTCRENHDGNPLDADLPALGKEVGVARIDPQPEDDPPG